MFKQAVDALSKWPESQEPNQTVGNDLLSDLSVPLVPSKNVPVLLRLR